MTYPAPDQRSEGLHYLDMRDRVAGRIASGELKPTDKLPSER